MAEGEFALVTERLDKALELSGQPVKRGTMAHEHIVHMMVVDSCAVSEDGDGLKVHAPRLAELAGRDEHQPYLAVARRAMGVEARLAGDYEAAENHLAGALEIFRERGMTWQTGRTLYELGRLAAAAGSKSAPYFAEALALFEEIGAQPFAEQVRTAMGTAPGSGPNGRDPAGRSG